MGGLHGDPSPQVSWAVGERDRGERRVEEGARAFIGKWRKFSAQLIRKCHEANPHFMAFLELMTASSQPARSHAGVCSLQAHMGLGGTGPHSLFSLRFCNRISLNNFFVIM